MLINEIAVEIDKRVDNRKTEKRELSSFHNKQPIPLSLSLALDDDSKKQQREREREIKGTNIIRLVNTHLVYFLGSVRIRLIRF